MQAWAHFDAWCRSKDVDPDALPLNPVLVAAYLGALAKSHGASALRSRVAAIAYHHRRRGFTFLPTHPVIRETLGGIRRSHPRKGRPAAALCSQEVKQLLDVCPTDLAGLRDRALFLVGFSALQTRVVDGQENPLSLVSSGKFYEVQKYASMTNHVWDAYWIVCNARIWNRLPKPIQEVLGRNLDAGALRVRTDVAKLNDDLRADLTQRGMVINDTVPESFRKQLQAAGFYKEWRGKVGQEAWALLEKQVGQLA